MRARLRTFFAYTIYTSVLLIGAAQAEPLRLAVDILPPSLGNPYRTSLPPTVWTNSAMFDALTRFDDAGNVVPSLALSWEKIDNFTWRFKLRPGVKFHNGAPFTADAVVTAIKYIVSDEAIREGIRREVGVFKDARAVDDLTVDIITTEPAPQMARYMTGLMIGEPKAWREMGRDLFAKQPIGTGPFKMVEMQANVWKLAPFKEAWRTTRLEGLEVIALPETSARTSGVLAGRIHIAMSLSPDNLAELEDAGHEGITTIDPSVFGFSFILFKKSPLQDVRVRRALNMAVNRQRIIDALLGGATVPASQPATRTVLGYDASVPQYKYDPEAAKKLLAEAGFPNGFSFVMEGATGVDANDTAIFQQVQSDLREIGVTMEIRTMPALQYYNALGRTDFSGEAFPADWQAWPINDVTRSVLAHSCQRPTPWYCDDAIMPTIVAARTEFDEIKALQYRHKIAQYYHDQAPALFMYEAPAFVGVSSKVKNYKLINGTHFAFTEMEVSK
ncbi:MAG: ABC transporter substrate-binding protein [Rhodospirillaceae bacterium]|nr:ABC transporter substrate-binding protein [Rhodospirillaceae bacterium]